MITEWETEQLIKFRRQRRLYGGYYRGGGQ